MPDQIDDGGGAFPLPETTMSSVYGMSLREWYAGQAITAAERTVSRMLPTERVALCRYQPTAFHDVVSIVAYQIADAMIRRRRDGK